MKTIILFWNPEISDVSVTAFRMSMREERTTWEIHCHERAEVGDIVFLVRCDKPSGGIVQRGIIVGEPIRAEHWYKEKAHAWYADIAVTHVVNPLTAPLITVEQLQRAIPGFKWDGGHSGRVLRSGWAKKLNEMWEKYLQDTPALFKGGTTGYDFSKEAYAVPLDTLLYDSLDCRVWMEIGARKAKITQITLTGLPEEGAENPPTSEFEDIKETEIDLTFGIAAATRALGIDGRFELFHYLKENYAKSEAVKLLSDYLNDHKVKIELEQYDEDDQES